MGENRDFSLPPRPMEQPPPNRLIIALLALVIAVGLAGLLVPFARRGSGTDGLSAKRLEELALRFERERLAGAAARAWTDYLTASGEGPEARARVWYRIGTLYQEQGDYESALEAYHRSEATAKLDDVASELGQRTAESLEGLGLFAALGYELEERTAVAKTDSTAGAEVLAEIGSRKITRADLDVMIEAEIDAQLLQLAGSLTPEERRRQKEKLLAGVLTEEGRARFLEQFVAEEVLYRRAMEEKLPEDPELRALTRSIERKILAQRLLDREYASRITVGPDELKTYYEGHTDEFKKDGAVQPFDSVKDRVYAAVRYQKETEVQTKLLDELRGRYDVVVHRSKLGGK